jgi:methyl-accepting chemotaxis protein
LAICSRASKALLDLPLTKRLVSDWYRIIFGGSRRNAAIAKSSDNSLVASFAEDAAKGSKESGEILKQVAKLLTSEQERQLLEEIGKSRDYYLAQRAVLTKVKEADNTEEAAAANTEEAAAAKEIKALTVQQVGKPARMIVVAVGAHHHVQVDRARTKLFLQDRRQRRTGIPAVDEDLLAKVLEQIGLTLDR